MDEETETQEDGDLPKVTLKSCQVKSGVQTSQQVPLHSGVQDPRCISPQ